MQLQHTLLHERTLSSTPSVVISPAGRRSWVVAYTRAGRSPAALLPVRARPGVGRSLAGASVAARRPVLFQRLVGDLALARPQRRQQAAAAELRRHLVLQSPAVPLAATIKGARGGDPCPGGADDDGHPAAAVLVSGGRTGRRGEQEGGGKEEEDREGRARRHCAQV
uniref:Uncharacterized protein n=1 Tax=Setaria italica TaxID=4555 RepID=K3ZAA9_SETIT